MSNKLQNRGFTLIELLTVMFIIGILGSVAVPQYMRSVRRAEMTEGLTHGKTILDAAARYSAVNGDKPATFSQLDISFIGANFDGNEFDDGSFIYRLPAGKNYISASSTKGGYELRFQYPTVKDNRVEAAIVCCPKNNWICKNSFASEATIPDVTESAECRQ